MSALRHSFFLETPKRLLASSSPTYLILLNNPSGLSTELLTACWRRCDKRVAADGAANYLHALRASHPELIPDAVVGDLDSASSEALDYFKKFPKICTVTKNPCQDTTDLMKCLHVLETYPDARSSTVLLLGALGGPRFDHEMQNFNTAYMYMHRFERFILISKDMMGEVLAPGQHELEIDKRVAGPTCGLIPLFGAAEVRTRGLRWNLPVDDKSRGLLVFGGIVSSSNEILFEGQPDQFCVHLETDHPMVWSVVLSEDLSPLEVDAAKPKKPAASPKGGAEPASASPKKTRAAPTTTTTTTTATSPKSKPGAASTAKSVASPPKSKPAEANPPTVVLRVSGVPASSGAVTGPDLVKLILAKVGEIQELSSFEEAAAAHNNGSPAPRLSFRVRMSLGRDAAGQIERVLRDPIAVDGQTVRVTLDRSGA